MPGYEILCAGCWEAADVVVEPGRQRPAWPAAFPRQAEVMWHRARQSNENLFNGSLASLVAYRRENGKLVLQLGETCFRDQMFSNARIGTWTPQEQQRYATRALGISAVVFTRDARIVMITRSQQVSEHAGCRDVIGGHIDPQQHRNTAGRPDVFLAIADEIHSELGIAPGRLVALQCIGLAENCAWRKPELVFFARLAESEAGVRAAAASAAERFEYTAIDTFAATPAGLRRYLKALSGQLSPSAAASLELYRRHLAHERRTCIPL